MNAGTLASAPTPTKGQYYAMLVVRAADFIVRQRKFCESRSQTRGETAASAATPTTVETSASANSTSSPSLSVRDQRTVRDDVSTLAPGTDSAKTPEATARVKIWSIVAVFNGTQPA